MGLKNNPRRICEFYLIRCAFLYIMNLMTMCVCKFTYFLSMSMRAQGSITLKFASMR